MDKIVTLLVPTDFSVAAKAAAMYAAKMAAVIKARVILLNVVEMDTSDTVLHNWKTLESQATKSALSGLNKLAKEVRAAVKEPIEMRLDMVIGLPLEEIVARYAKENKVDVIVMGTKGASGLRKIVSGSNTSRLIEESTVPVIAVPSKAAYTQLKKIVYASDLKNVHAETKALARIAALFNAEILVLHCVSPGQPSRVDRSLEPSLIEQSQYGAISYHQVQNDQIDKAIGAFIEQHQADMLVMYTHETDFIDRVMGKSVTRSVAFQNKVPMLVFNRSLSPRQ